MNAPIVSQRQVKSRIFVYVLACVYGVVLTAAILASRMGAA
jgi:hypothetical protein